MLPNYRVQRVQGPAGVWTVSQFGPAIPLCGRFS